MRLLKIGRDPGCDIVLGNSNVSALHAEITLLNSGDIILEDKGSQNGTFVMGQRIKPGKPVKITRGDRIQFGNVDLVWSQIPMPEDNSAYKAIYGIGSHFSNEIQLVGSTVSRYHATIKCGRDGKVYIVDHSKNGTTLNGAKIPKNTPVKINRNSSVVCGGVPVNIKNNPIIPWPTPIWSKVSAIAAMLIVVVTILYFIFPEFPIPRTYDDKELYEIHKNDVVMLRGIYHFEIEAGDLTESDFSTLGLPQKMLYDGDKRDFLPINSLSAKDLIDIFDKKGIYGGTGFFISQDGMLLTNLHIVKPWLFGQAKEDMKQLENAIRKYLSAKAVEHPLLTSYLSQVKVKGVLDYIALIPQGEIFDGDNIIKCKVVSAGEDENIDVALIQTVSKRLPTKECTFVDIDKLLDESDEAMEPGTHIYTLGFPLSISEGIQKEKEETGIQVIGQGGNITMKHSEYEFAHNAPTYGGASGSPIFNNRNKLIGIHHAGYSQSVTQGYNFGIKAKYIKELITNPHVK